jgi:hypothetical protein
MMRAVDARAPCTWRALINEVALFRLIYQAAHAPARAGRRQGAPVGNRRRRHHGGDAGRFDGI